MSKAKTKQEEALEFLDTLDTFSPDAPSPSTTTTGEPAKPSDASDVLAFIDEITQKSAEPTTRTTLGDRDRPASRAGTPQPQPLRKTTERVRLTPSASAPSGAGGLRTPSPSPVVPYPASRAPAVASGTGAGAGSGGGGGGGGGGWGWGSVWSTASTALQQAKTVVDEQVKHLPRQEQAMRWRDGVMEYAKSAQLDKLGEDFKRVGLSTLTDILNVVAPPISEHEVIKVWLSHDMHGFEGVESLVYGSLSRIMEQVQGGDLVVNRGNEVKPRDGADGPAKRDIQAIDGLDAAIKLAQTNIEELVRRNADAAEHRAAAAAQTMQNPTTTSHVYLRLQPYTTMLALPASASSDATTRASLQFLVHLVDAEHRLAHTAVTQAVPATWLDVWDEHDWVEDLVAEALRVGVEVVGQEYIVARMGWTKKDADVGAGADAASEVVAP